RCFNNTDIIHVNGKIDPIDDIETINLELTFADLEVIEKRLPKIEKKAQLKIDSESELEYGALKKAKSALEKGISLRNHSFSDEEKVLLKGYNFLTLKPMIYVLNVNEDEVSSDNEYVTKVKEHVETSQTKTVVISAKIEEEICELEDEDRALFLAELGISESGLDKLVKQTYDLLGLATYFTAGEKEAKAWTFKKGMKAPECAGIIHTDFEKGFIRAEIIAYDDFIKCGGLQKAKEAGKMRSEGKEYLFKDGDIALFRFNV
ncbi:MAG: redox-regulated ATPase YchF, partial [Bacilli bacterium]